MVEIRINGENSPIHGGELSKLADVVELIKTAIDPEHMITAIRLNGSELHDDDWTRDPNSLNPCIVEVETGTPESYVAYRVSLAANIMDNIHLEFQDSRKEFQGGELDKGNKIMIGAVNDLKAFFEWYGALLELVPEDKKEMFNIEPQVEKMTEICKKICQQQLYQSWWALSESLEKELEPELKKLENFYKYLASQIASN